MNYNQKILIGEKEYLVVNSIQDMRAEDSFIAGKNKLEQYSGSGEARKYVGSYKGNSGKKISDFFDYKFGGVLKGENGSRIFPEIQSSNCFFSKSNLLKYMENAKQEYFSMEQKYQRDISKFFNNRLKKVHELKDELLYFSIHDVSDQKDNNLSRSYIRSHSKYWKLWRDLILPHITYLSILKLTSLEGGNKDVFFYFRIFIDYGFRSIVHPSLLGSKQEELEKQFNSAKFKENVHGYMHACPFSEIVDERMLTASHIKPKAKCLQEGNLEEAMDYLNGLSLTPTYDRLFDRGYITFDDKGNLICGHKFSPMTWKRLNIDPNKNLNFDIRPAGREKYLDYHRKHVFQE